MKPNDLLQRKLFATWSLKNIPSDPNFLRRIVFPDECVFHISEIANNKNEMFWGTENPRLLQENEITSAKSTIWCGIHASGVLDPYYLDSETVRAADYYELRNTYDRSSRHSFPQNNLFQQDGAFTHTRNIVRPILDSKSPDSWIGKHGPYNWPPRSPDLSHPEFFL